MMKIEKLVLGSMNTNVYLLFYEKEVFVIDPACNYDAIVKAAGGLPITNVLLTHGHFDHCGAAAELQKAGAKIYMARLDHEMIKNGYDLARFCGTFLTPFTPDEFIGEGVSEIGGQAVKVLSTPGHTAGSLSFIVENNIFSGDVLFYLSVGRSDLPTGDKRQLTASVKRLYGLGDAQVFPGHGRSTELSFERKNNPYVKAD